MSLLLGGRCKFRKQGFILISCQYRYTYYEKIGLSHDYDEMINACIKDEEEAQTSVDFFGDLDLLFLRVLRGMAPSTVDMDDSSASLPEEASRSVEGRA